VQHKNVSELARASASEVGLIRTAPLREREIDRDALPTREGRDRAVRNHSRGPCRSTVLSMRMSIRRLACMRVEEEDKEEWAEVVFKRRTFFIQASCVQACETYTRRVYRHESRFFTQQHSRLPPHAALSLA
jgi:hypothetical protein